MRRELTVYLAWFNEHRPSQALGGRTPNEVYTGQPPANAALRFEPRTMWPRRSSCAAPQALDQGTTRGHAYSCRRVPGRPETSARR
jgi:hypothetical protein